MADDTGLAENKLRGVHDAKPYERNSLLRERHNIQRLTNFWNNMEGGATARPTTQKTEGL